MKKKILIAITTILGIGLLAIIIYVIVLLSAFGFFDKDYSIPELKNNFEKNKAEIYELIEYYNSIAPVNKYVEIEFKNNKTIARFSIQEYDSTSKECNSLFLDWDLSVGSEIVDSLISTIGWTNENLKLIKGKLDKANCIMIENRDHIRIGFQRSGLGMYFFNVFDKPIPDSLITDYNDSCTYIYVDRKLVLEYGGGAIGPQCFYNLR